MTDTPLHTLASAAGLLVDWIDASDTPRTVGTDTLRSVLGALGLDARDDAACRDSLRQLQAGGGSAAPLLTADVGTPIDAGGTPGAAYRLEHEDGSRRDGRFDAQGRLAAIDRYGYWTLQHGDRHTTLAVAPVRCYGVAEAIGEDAPRRWGLSLQVYSAQGPDDAGIGDADGVAAWSERIARAGGDAIALSPVHAARPIGTHYSPYSPGDRRFLDPLQAAPARVLGTAMAQRALQAAGLQQAFAEAQTRALIDWPASSAAKWQWLRQLHADFAQADAALHADFAAFQHERGAALHDYAAFAARDFGDADPALHSFAQWLAARSWAGVQRHARDAGMGIGLIADLAVGFDPGGAEAAAWPQAVLAGLELGAPPDAFNGDGQAWGIGGYSPTGLRASGFAPFIDLLRAVMRDRGGVRIDHILGLLRLWTIPRGARSADGVYLRYPLHDLLRLLALESWRHHALVIGEDLGVVPDGIRAELSQRGVMGIDVLLFTRDAKGAFLAPAQWRGDAIATTTTHDLPTLRGWRRGEDIDWRHRLQLSDAAQQRADHLARIADVARMDAAVAAALPQAHDPELDALRFVAATPSPLALLPAEDALGLDQQPNLPGTVDGHPNWRRRLPAADTAAAGAPLATRLEAFAHARRTASAAQGTDA
ncbi:4-alpha-glucanotransferase [Xanthomonas sp. JAI131]|uniref:4-alpha-glucanotransferase n=1 Tax=Xanthomonas sp. JAI131 TaxID=2723067 RepID=UPI0015C99DDD|nr:4-alpha-glucanotransferase [Xanthomonas sp. JAI131]NYF20899.1 4-alpha-glucanotransferase [Xanthomonas sp. JAI131]